MLLEWCCHCLRYEEKGVVFERNVEITALNEFLYSTMRARLFLLKQTLIVVLSGKLVTHMVRIIEYRLGVQPVLTH